MSFKISDRCAVFFSNVTGNNISAERATRLAKELSAVGNSQLSIPKGIIKALERKHAKHSDLSVNVDLALFHSRRADTILNKGIDSQKNMMDAEHHSMNNFMKNASELSDGIIKFTTDFNTRATMGIMLEEKHGFDFTTNEKIDCDISSLAYQREKYITKLNANLTEKNHVIDGLRNNGFDDKKIEELVSRKFGSNEKQLVKRINFFDDKISNKQNEIDNNKKRIVEVVVDIAKQNRGGMSKKIQPLLKQYQLLESNYKSSPYVIEKIKSNIKTLESNRENVSNYSETLAHLKDMLIITEVIKDSNRVLEKKAEENKEIYKLSSEGFAAGKEAHDNVSTAISGNNKRVPEMHGIQFPEPPKDEPGLSNNYRAIKRAVAS